MPKSVFNSQLTDYPSSLSELAKKVGYTLTGSDAHNLFKLNGVVEVVDGKCRIIDEPEALLKSNPMTANLAMKPLLEECHPSVSMKIIELFGLDGIFGMDAMIDKILAREMADIEAMTA